MTNEAYEKLRAFLNSAPPPDPEAVFDGLLFISSHVPDLLNHVNSLQESAKRLAQENIDIEENKKYYCPMLHIMCGNCVRRVDVLEYIETLRERRDSWTEKYRAVQQENDRLRNELVRMGTGGGK